MKLIADFYVVEDDPENKAPVRERKIATVVFDRDTNVVSTPDDSKGILRLLSAEGAMGKEQERYYPKDGEKFMRALPYLSGSRFGVTLREEK